MYEYQIVANFVNYRLPHGVISQKMRQREENGSTGEEARVRRRKDAETKQGNTK